MRSKIVDIHILKSAYSLKLARTENGSQDEMFYGNKKNSVMDCLIYGDNPNDNFHVNCTNMEQFYGEKEFLNMLKDRYKLVTKRLTKKAA